LRRVGVELINLWLLFRPGDKFGGGWVWRIPERKFIQCWQDVVIGEDIVGRSDFVETLEIRD
jgi:hypothetical protein